MHSGVTETIRTRKEAGTQVHTEAITIIARIVRRSFSRSRIIVMHVTEVYRMVVFPSLLAATLIIIRAAGITGPMAVITVLFSLRSAFA